MPEGGHCGGPRPTFGATPALPALEQPEAVTSPIRHALRVVLLAAISLTALQVYWLSRVALMRAVDPQSTSFQRSEAWRLLRDRPRLIWSQQWVSGERISPQLKRAVIASEDAAFVEHSGIDWDAVERGWERNLRAQARAERRNQHLDRRGDSTPVPGPAVRSVPRLVGGSTITQQLAKNLFLSGERTLLRKTQEAAITLMLETLLSKQRILEIYLNSVEWGEGVFGAQAAAMHYFHTDAAALGVGAASRLAVMLPAPKKFERNPGSAYVSGRAAIIAARMAAVELP
jgi:monofunctional biosynthetic peptidoglycan transglycosylase